MVDPTSDLGEDVSEEDAPRCAVCGEPILQSATHRVVSWVADGESHVRQFCSDDCRHEWLETHEIDAR
jgi:hypothetical protein